MSTRIWIPLLLLALAAAPSPATAGGSARAGLMYSRVNLWPESGPSSEMPYLDIDLGLDLRGVIVSRDVCDYRLSAGWTHVNQSTTGVVTTKRNVLTYSGQTSILQNAVSPVGVSAFANRGQSDFATSGVADSFGSGISTSAGGVVLVRGPRLPLLELGYNWTGEETHIEDQPVRASRIHTMYSTLSFGTPAFDMSANYSGEVREGSWETDNYQRHGVTLRANGWIGKNVLTLESSTSVNIPAQLVPGTFDQKTTSFTAMLNAGGTGTRRNFSYLYGHTITASPGAPTGELNLQGVTYEGDHFQTGEFFTRWLVNASMSEARSDATVLRSSGETLGVSLWWHRVLPSATIELHGGPRVAILESDGDYKRGYGATAGARIIWPFGLHTLQGNWLAVYGRDAFASAGWQLQQQLGASLSGPALHARYNLSLSGSAFRTSSPVLGEGAGRVFQAVATLARPRLATDLRVVVSNGMVGATPKEFIGDGLFIPAPFDSMIIDASTGVTYTVLAGLGTSARLHWGRSDVPGRPALHEVAGIVGLNYGFGGLGVSLEDRYTRTEVTNGWVAWNSVMVTVYRLFNW